MFNTRSRKLIVRFILFVFPVGVLFLLCSWKTYAANTHANTTLSSEQVRQLGKDGNLKALQEIVAQFQTFSDEEVKANLSYIAAVSSTLTTYDFGRNTYEIRYALAQKCAKLALASGGDMPIFTKIFFLGKLMIDLPTTDASEFERERKERAEMFLSTLLEVENLKKKKKQELPTGIVTFTVQPPAGVRGFSGMSPKNIKDPKLRTQYEESIRENQRKAAQINAFELAVRAENSLRSDVERYLMRSYSKMPYKLEELQKLFQTYPVNEGTKAKVLASVRAFTSA